MKSYVILAVFCVAAQGFPQRGPQNYPGLEALLSGRRPNNYSGANTEDTGEESRGKLACIKACVGPTKCPSRQEIKNETKEDRKECRDCIRASCDQLDPLDRRAVMKCVREAFENCTSCPPIPTKDRERVINCSSCLMQCRKHDRRGPGGVISNGVRPTPFGGIGTRNNGMGLNIGQGSVGGPMGPGYNTFGGSLSANKPRRRRKPSSTCHKTCLMLQYCPNMKEMKEKMQNVKKECKDCVTEECGEMSTNKTEDASCIAEARQECVECPPLSDADQMNKKKCFECLKQCSKKHNDDDESEEESNEESFGFGLESILGQEGLPGLLQSIVPLISQGMGQGFERPRQNRPMTGGVGPFSGGRGSISGGIGPFSGGRGPMSGGIAPFSSRRGLMSRGIGPFSVGRGPMSGGIGPILGGRRPMSRGIGPLSGSRGPMSGMTQFLPRSNGPVAGFLSQITGGPRPMSGGIGPFSGGRGRSPFSGRGRPHDRFSKPKEFLHKILKVITCARSEENCASCPTPKEARMRMINATIGCRKCVKEECGDTDAGNSTDKAECIRQARIDCLQCPPLTESEQMEKKKCIKCLMECAPKVGKPEPFGPHRGSFVPRPGPFGPRRGGFNPEHGILGLLGTPISSGSENEEADD